MGQVPGAAIRTESASVVSSSRILAAVLVYCESPGYRAAWPSLMIGNQWLTCMMPFAFERRPCREVPTTLLARTVKARRTTAEATPVASPGDTRSPETS